jgi:excisionase family DNA binding protein
MSTASKRSPQKLPHPIDRLMTIKELAAYLSINERTLLKLVADGSLPGVKIGNQWRFRKVMIEAWLDDQMLGVAPRQVEIRGAPPTPRRMIELASCFQPHHIIAHLEANKLIGVVDELATLASALGLVRDKNWFVGALIERENIIPGAVGNGVAFLHTMYRHPEQIVRPFMVLGRSMRGVECDAMDGKPTHLFFVLGLKFHELHLPWLAKLAQMFARTEATRAVLEAPTPEAIFKILCAAEKALFAPAARD